MSESTRGWSFLQYFTQVLPLLSFLIARIVTVYSISSSKGLSDNFGSLHTYLSPTFRFLSNLYASIHPRIDNSLKILPSTPISRGVKIIARDTVINNPKSSLNIFMTPSSMNPSTASPTPCAHCRHLPLFGTTHDNALSHEQNDSLTNSIQYTPHDFR